MQIRALIRLCLVGVCALLLTTSCGTAQQPSAPPAALAFITTDGSYAARAGESIALNLAFEHTRQESFETENITSITLEPASPIAQVAEFQVFSLGIGNLRARKALRIELNAQQPGEHTFTTITITTQQNSFQVPLGNLRLQVVDGPRAGAMVVFQAQGVFVGVPPMTFTLANHSNTTLTLTEILPPHPRLDFSAANIAIKNGDETIGTLASGGLEVAPGARIDMLIEWSVDLPENEALSIEWIPLLVFEGADGRQYTPMAGVVLRNELANKPLD